MTSVFLLTGVFATNTSALVVSTNITILLLSTDVRLFTTIWRNAKLAHMRIITRMCCVALLLRVECTGIALVYP